MTIGYNALIFNKVWLSDETGVIGDDAADYKAAMVFALTKAVVEIFIKRQILAACSSLVWRM